MHSNLTETCREVLRHRAAFLTAHREYIEYLQHLLDTATLPASEVPLPNMTTMAAMVAEMRPMHPTAPWISGVVLGRVLHRVLPAPLLTWHGSRHQYFLSGSLPVTCETTLYRFPMVQRCRTALSEYLATPAVWLNAHDQWQFARNKADFDDGLGASPIDRLSK